MRLRGCERLSGLVHEAAPPMVSFSHGLVHAVDSSLSVLRRVDLHRRAATALVGDNPSQPDVIAQIAHHWVAVAEIDSSAALSAAYWTVRAGDAALASAAAEEAIARYESATRLWARSTTEHADTLIRLGNALYSCGRGPEADGRFREAFHLAQGLNDDKLVALAALGLAKAFAIGEIAAERVAALETHRGAAGPTSRRLRRIKPCLKKTFGIGISRCVIWRRGANARHRSRGRWLLRAGRARSDRLLPGGS